MTLAIVVVVCVTVLALAALARDGHVRTLAARVVDAAGDGRLAALAARLDVLEQTRAKADETIATVARQVNAVVAQRKH